MVELALARRGHEMAEVESLTRALEGAAVEKQGFSEALALKRQRVGTLERQVASLLGKMAAAREEVNICILHNIRSALLIQTCFFTVSLSEVLYLTILRSGGRFEKSTWGIKRRSG